MNGSLMHGLIEANFWEIMEDFCGENVDNMSDKEADEISKKEEFQEFSQRWVSENY